MTMTVEIDNDVYELLRRQLDFNESESDVLRRLLSPLLQTKECPKCEKAVYVAKTHQISGKLVYSLRCGHLLSEKTPEKVVSPKSGNSQISVEKNRRGPSALVHFVSDPAFLCRNTTERYLAILGFAYREKQDKFAKVLNVSGRRRKYFAASHEEIDKSGTSTHPHAVPGSDKKYWAMTNADTTQKRDMLSKALQVLEYDPTEIEVAARAIDDDTRASARQR
jgi:negative modulator of initiation of replication